MRAKHIIGAVVCIAAALPSYALTNISACGAYSTNDNYVVTADISSSSTTVACLTWSGISNTTNGIYIDLNGHNVVSTGYHAIDIDTSVANIYIHDSVGTGSVRGKVGFSGSGVFDTPAMSILNSATMPGGWILITGVHAYGLISVVSNNKTTYPMKSLHGEYNTIRNGGWNIQGVDNATLTGEMIDNRYDTTIVTQGYSFADCSGSRVEYSTVIGGPGSNSQSSTLNTDDAVIVACTGNQGACSNHIADHITSYDLFDAAWEGEGHLTDMHVTNNVSYRPKAAGVGGYYIFSLGNSEIRNNTVFGATRLFYMFAASGASEVNNFFTNNVFDNNRIDVSTSSIFGVVGSGPFATFSNNTFSNNFFGFGSTIQFQSSAGVIDGGGNHCGSTNAVGFSC